MKKKNHLKFGERKKKTLNKSNSTQICMKKNQGNLKKRLH